jgi:Predicted glycosyltransferases
MLSILIPTYNYECLGLVEELHRQAQALSFPIEILVADDASKEELKRNNRKINKLSNCMFIELKENVGRAKIRNFLSEKASYNLLLFIDSDAGLISNNFLQDYVSAIQNNDVVCGGLLYDRPLPSVMFSLRYYYGISTEERSAKVRNLHPYAQFSSFSFLIRKKRSGKFFLMNHFQAMGMKIRLLVLSLKNAE